MSDIVDTTFYIYLDIHIKATVIPTLILLVVVMASCLIKDNMYSQDKEKTVRKE